jgi:hypothetical protein
MEILWKQWNLQPEYLDIFLPEMYGVPATPMCSALRCLYKGKKKIKISLLQAVEAPWVARGRGYHIT